MRDYLAEGRRDVADYARTGRWNVHEEKPSRQEFARGVRDGHPLLNGLLIGAIATAWQASRGRR